MRKFELGDSEGPIYVEPQIPIEEPLLTEHNLKIHEQQQHKSMDELGPESYESAGDDEANSTDHNALLLSDWGHSLFLPGEMPSVSLAEQESTRDALLALLNGDYDDTIDSSGVAESADAHPASKKIRVV